MQKFKIIFTVLILMSLLYTLYFIPNTSFVHADECDSPSSLGLPQLSGCLNKLNDVLGQIAKANATNKEQLNGLQKQINGLKNQLNGFSQELAVKQEGIDQSDQKLNAEYEKLTATIRSFYIESYYSNVLTAVFNARSAQEAFYSVRLYSFLSRQKRDTIANLVNVLNDLTKSKQELTQAINQTAALKAKIDEQANFLSGEVAKASNYEQKLQNQIAALSARQQDILTQRLAGLNIPRSAAAMGRCDSDLTNGRDPGFSPKLAVFTYGVPNRVGLNQWGAKGRADAGQNYDQILRAYYNFDEYKNVDTNIQISVRGYQSYSIEEYVKRIYEVPGDWPPEVLKAQAIAARSYALAYTNNGANSICATEACQVFQSNPKGGAWDQAVNETSGKVMIQGGQPIKAWFSSTHGGYVFSSGEIGWSGTSWTKHATDTDGSANSFSDLQNNSYDKGSPWFYCDWGSRSNYNKTAWLKPEEMADIVNVLMLAQRDSGTVEHLYQTDKSNPAGTDTWDNDRVKSELRSHGGSPYNSVADVSVSADFGAGRTTNVTVSGDAGSQTFDAHDFKNYFNLRAPANIQIVGSLFNIEKK